MSRDEIINHGISFLVGPEDQETHMQCCRSRENDEAGIHKFVGQNFFETSLSVLCNGINPEKPAEIVSFRLYQGDGYGEVANPHSSKHSH
jgi:hypothetical protein